MLNCIRIAVIVVFTVGVTKAQGDDFHTDMMRATVKLKHDKSTAAGFVLRQSRAQEKGGSRSVLVTAAHVLDRVTGDETTLVYRVREAEGVYKKESMPLMIRKGGQPVWTRHPTEDVAALVIVFPEKADLAEVPVDLLASDELLRQHAANGCHDWCSPGSRVR